MNCANIYIECHYCQYNLTELVYLLQVKENKGKTQHSDNLNICSQIVEYV